MYAFFHFFEKYNFGNLFNIYFQKYSHFTLFSFFYRIDIENVKTTYVCSQLIFLQNYLCFSLKLKTEGETDFSG